MPGPLRSPTGASPLATGNCSPIKKRRSRGAVFFMSAANTLVVGVFFLRVVGHVANALELGNAFEQGALDAFTQGDVGLAAALATAAELEDGDAVFNHIDQADLTAVARQPRVDLGLQVVVDALVDRAVGVDHRYFGVRRLDGQLAAHAVGGVVDYRIVQERFAERVDIRGEAFEPQRG